MSRSAKRSKMRVWGAVLFLSQSVSLFLCVIRAMPITESGASRSPIPAHGDHPIRAMPITDQASPLGTV